MTCALVNLNKRQNKSQLLWVVLITQKYLKGLKRFPKRSVTQKYPTAGPWGYCRDTVRCIFHVRQSKCQNNLHVLWILLFTLKYTVVPKSTAKASNSYPKVPKNAETPETQKYPEGTDMKSKVLKSSSVYSKGLKQWLTCTPKFSSTYIKVFPESGHLGALCGTSGYCLITVFSLLGTFWYFQVLWGILGNTWDTFGYFLVLSGTLGTFG